MSEQILVAAKSGHVSHIASNIVKGKAMCGRDWGREVSLLGGVGCCSCRNYEGHDLRQRIRAFRDKHRPA